MEDKNIVVMPVVRHKPWVNSDKYNKNKVLAASTTLQPYLGIAGLTTGLEGNKELQAQFEKDLRLSDDALNPVVTNEYWGNFNIKLEDGPNIFHRTSPLDMLKVLVLKNHPAVAESESEITPDSQFYILDEALESSKKASKTDLKVKAYLRLNDMSPSEQRQFLKLFGKGGIDMSDKDVYSELGELIEKNTESFLIKSDFSKEKVNITAFIFDLVQYGVLRLRGSHYFDVDTNVGNLETLRNTLLAPEKQDSYLNYKERLEHAKRGN